MYKTAAAIDVNDEEIWLAWAQAAARQDVRQAIAILNLFLRDHAESSSAHLALAKLYQQEQAHKFAFEAAMAAAQLKPQDAGTWRLVAEEALKMRRFKEAEHAMRQVVSQAPNAWQSHVVLGNFLVNRKRNAEAIQHFRNALRFRPEEATAHVGLGIALLNQAVSSDDRKTAERHLLRGAQLDPGSPVAYVELGRIYALDGRWRQALQSYKEALRLQPENAQTYFEVSRVYRRLGNIAEAQRASRLHDKYREQQRAFEKLINAAHDAQSPDDFLQLARGLAAQGDIPKAAAAYRSLLSRYDGAESRTKYEPQLKTAKQELEALRLP